MILFKDWNEDINIWKYLQLDSKIQRFSTIKTQVTIPSNILIGFYE